MDDILKFLFYGQLNETERSTEDLQKTKEFARLDEAYNALQEALSEKQKELLKPIILRTPATLRCKKNGFIQTA